MDAPPDKMSVAPYLKVQKLFDMVNVPQVLHADTDLGFVVLNDLGNTTFLTAMLQEQGEAAHKALLLEAIGELVGLQKASREGFCPNMTVKRCCAKSTCSRNGLSQKNWGAN